MNGKIRTYSVDSSNSAPIGIGDPVTLEADGNVTRAAAGGVILGVCVGKSVVSDVNEFGAGTSPHGNLNLQQVHVPASTAAEVRVIVDDGAIYEIQEDSTGGALALTAIGANADILSTAPDSTTGRSNVELDSSTLTSAGSAQVRIIDLVRAPDNEVGTNARWLVKLHETHLSSTNGI
jgi:hypothetical protein